MSGNDSFRPDPALAAGIRRAEEVFANGDPVGMIYPQRASAIEARRAATLGAVHESAGLQGDAQTPPKDL